MDYVKTSVIFGTRPEAIKLAPVILRMQAASTMRCRICVTGQHRQMLDQVMEAFGLVADVDLNLMTFNQSLSDLTARAVSTIGSYLERERPDFVLVQGDTTTVFAAALASFYQRIPLGHIEAGLRTWNLESPWPEEANRVLTSRLATLHFAPTELARDNLLREGVLSERICVTGNTVIDALFMTLQKVRANPPGISELPEFLQPGGDNSSLAPPLVLITGHRRENFGAAFEEICHAVAELARRFPDVHFVYPVHLNPQVREPVMRILGHGELIQPGHQTGCARAEDRSSGCGGAAPNIHLIEPLAYVPFVALMNRATLILTDSGGIQEEAPSLGKPVLVMRETTERPEAVTAGTALLVGTKRDEIVRQVERLLEDSAAFNRRIVNPYGDGHAAERIVHACERYLADQVRKPPATS